MTLVKSVEPPQRFGPMAGLPALLASYGIDPEQIFSEFGLVASSVTSDMRAPFALLVALLERAAQVSGRPQLGLELGSRFDHRALGPVGKIMECAPTLESALREFIKYQMTNSRAAAVYLCPIGDDFALGYGVYHRTSAVGRHLYDLCIAIGCNILRGLTNGAVRPTEIHINTAPPDDVAPYRQLLPAPVLFDQGHTCVILTRSDLAAPVPTRDPTERARLKAVLDASMGRNLNDAPARVRHLLRPRLLSGDCGLESVAAELAIHPRTLSRHLAHAGLTFEAVRDEVRFSVARELLELTDLPIGSIADALSYASHSAFVHAFNRWSGLSPSDWRRQRRTSAV